MVYFFVLHGLLTYFEDVAADTRLLEALAALQSGIQRLAKEMDVLNEGFNGLNFKLDEVQQDLSIVKADLSIAKADLSTVKTDLSIVKADLSIVKSNLK